MAVAQLQPIYERLNGIDNYHPYTATTFADWSLEAGDIVTVQRDGENYSSPANALTVNWKGSPTVSIESQGEKTRGSVAKMAAREYNAGSGGGNYRSGMRGSRAAQERLAGITESLDAVWIYARDVDNTHSAQIEVLNNRITVEVTDRSNADSTLSGRITVEANKISQIVSAVGANGQVTAASIVAAVNNAGSSVQISADHILLSGNVNLNEVMTVNGGSVYMRKPLYVNWDGSVTSILGGVISAQEVRVNHVMPLKVTNVTVDGNVLRISYADGSSANFSKATSLSGAWSGNITAGKSYLVTAKQNGTTVATHYSPSLDGYYKGSTSYDTSGYSWVSAPVTVYDEDGTDLYRETVQITIPSEVISYWQGQGGHTTAHTMYKGFNTSDDSIYYGQLYDGNGNALTNNSYYWFGCTSNVGGSNASVVMYT